MRFNHKNIWTSLLILLFIIQGTTIAFADRFYMAPNGSNDTGDGSRSNPYQTLSWIAGNALTPGVGDTVMVMSGTHAGDTRFVGFNYRVRGGGPDDYLVIMADPLGETRPLIDAADIANSCWSFTARYYDPDEDRPEDDAAYIKITGIDFANPIYYCINIDDGGSDSRTSPAHHFIIDDCLFTGGNEDRHGLKMAGVDTFLVQNCRFIDNIDAHYDMVGCHYGTIRDCIFITTTPVKSQGGGIVMKGGSDKILVDRCFFRTPGYCGVHIGQTTGIGLFRPPFSELDGDGDVMDYEAKNLTVYRCVFIDMTVPIRFINSIGGLVYQCSFYCPTDGAGELPTGVDYMINFHAFYTEIGGYPLTRSRDGRVINNIFSSYGSHTLNNFTVWAQVAYTSPETFLLSHNLWWNLQDPSDSEPDWDLLASFYGSPQHEGDIVGDPMYIGGSVMELPEHMQLSEGSPAATAGTEELVEVRDWFNGGYLHDLDYNNRVWSSPRSLGAFGMTVSGAPLSGPDVNRLLPTN